MTTSSIELTHGAVAAHAHHGGVKSKARFALHFVEMTVSMMVGMGIGAMLVVFTTLAITGAGLLTAPLLAWVGGQARAAASASALLLLGTALLAAGLLVSLAHLGQPRRAPLALTRSRIPSRRIANTVTVDVPALPVYA